MTTLIAQLSDPHLRMNDDASQAALARAVEQVRALRPAPVAVLVTGDIADSGSAEEHARARALLAPVTGVGDVAGDDHGVGRLGEREDARHGGGERGAGVLVTGALEPDVGIADLGEQGRRGHAAAD